MTIAFIASLYNPYFLTVGIHPCIFSMSILHIAGQTDVVAFRSMGLSQDGYIDKVFLALTNATTNSPVYYIVAKAVNGAGRESALMSSQ